tara:strand:+ start:1218 stop:1715 length:498 start_codon:yes stop_codon:yes gene_type:complete
MRTYFILLVFFISGCSSSQSIHLRYEGESYYLPNGVEEIGALGDRDSFLVFKYSREKGKKYLAFSSSESIEKGDCDYSEFFSSVIQKDDTRSPCDKDKLAAFRDAFTSGSGAGHWKINGLDHYYFITEHTGTFVFKVLSSDAILKIDSDFLDPEELYSIIEPGDS